MLEKCKFHDTPLRTSRENSFTLVCDKCKNNREFGHDGLYHRPNLQMKKNIKYKYNKKYVLDNFDFQTMNRVMIYLGRRYTNSKGELYSPTIDQLKKVANIILDKNITYLLNSSEILDFSSDANLFHCRSWIKEGEIFFDLKFVVEDSYND